MDLPKLTLNLRLPDPKYVPVFVEGQQWAVNRNEYDKDYDVEVEVVQLNINAGTMRVRFPWPTKHRKSGTEVRSQDVSISYFFDKYEIKEKV